MLNGKAMSEGPETSQSKLVTAQPLFRNPVK